jgi:hypothetical protein
VQNRTPDGLAIGRDPVGDGPSPRPTFARAGRSRAHDVGDIAAWPRSGRCRHRRPVARRSPVSRSQTLWPLARRRDVAAWPRSGRCLDARGPPFCHSPRAAVWPTAVARLGEAVVHSGQTHLEHFRCLAKAHRSRPPRALSLIFQKADILVWKRCLPAPRSRAKVASVVSGVAT